MTSSNTPQGFVQLSGIEVVADPDATKAKVRSEIEVNLGPEFLTGRDLVIDAYVGQRPVIRISSHAAETVEDLKNTLTKLESSLGWQITNPQQERKEAA